MEDKTKDKDKKTPLYTAHKIGIIESLAHIPPRTEPWNRITPVYLSECRKKYGQRYIDKIVEDIAFARFLERHGREDEYIAAFAKIDVSRLRYYGKSDAELFELFCPVMDEYNPLSPQERQWDDMFGPRDMSHHVYIMGQKSESMSIFNQMIKKDVPEKIEYFKEILNDLNY